MNRLSWIPIDLDIMDNPKIVEIKMIKKLGRFAHSCFFDLIILYSNNMHLADEDGFIGLHPKAMRDALGTKKVKFDNIMELLVNHGLIEEMGIERTKNVIIGSQLCKKWTFSGKFRVPIILESYSARCAYIRKDKIRKDVGDDCLKGEPEKMDTTTRDNLCALFGE